MCGAVHNWDFNLRAAKSLSANPYGAAHGDMETRLSRVEGHGGMNDDADICRSRVPLKELDVVGEVPAEQLLSHQDYHRDTN